MLNPGNSITRVCCNLGDDSFPSVVLPSRTLNCLDFSEALATVPLRRAVVEDMLVQRFTERVRKLSDVELANLMEQLLAPQSQFPAELLLPAPALPPPTKSASPTPQQSSQTSQSASQGIEEEDDDTAALLEALQNPATDAAGGGASETVGGAAAAALGNLLPIPASFFGPDTARKIGIVLGFSAAVPMAVSMARRRKGTEAGDTTAAAAQDEFTAGAPGGKGGGFFSWLFPKGSDDGPQDSAVVPESSMQRAGEDSTGGRVPPPAEPSQVGGVLWRRKESEEHVPKGTSGEGVASAQGNGGVLWQREEGTAPTSVGAQGQGSGVDLWRVPMEQLRGGAPGDSSFSEPGRGDRQAEPGNGHGRGSGGEGPLQRQPGAAGGGVRGGRGVRSGGNVLDNAEPAGFAVDAEL